MNNTNMVSENLKKQIEKLLVLLSEKEKNVIKRRYALNLDDYETLAKIGNRYHVTRERIRQIQNSAIKKLQKYAVNTPLKDLNTTGRRILREHGGIIAEKKLYALMTKRLPFQPDIKYLKLSLELDPSLEKIGNTHLFQPHWKFRSIPNSLLKTISRTYRTMLEKHEKIISIDELKNTIKEPLKNVISSRNCSSKHVFQRFLNKKIILELAEIDKEIKITAKGIGLTKWRDINPHTIKDKIFYIMRNGEKPLHFREITKKINQYRFDNKQINIQTVHNELIRNPKFVLIGRGIYAFDEWGYRPGTVADVIEEVLRKAKTPLTRKRIIDEVQKQRRVKTITIVLNLKNNDYFQRVGRDRYAMQK